MHPLDVVTIKGLVSDSSYNITPKTKFYMFFTKLSNKYFFMSLVFRVEAFLA